MTGGEDRLSLIIQFPIGSHQVTIAADDLFLVGIPYDELLVAVLAGVELIDVHLLACAAACLAEGDLAQTTDLAHDIGCLMGGHHVDLVVALVGHSELSLTGEFTLQQLFADRTDNLLFHVCLKFYS